ncbi:hypothetical protein MJ1_0039 [Nanobdella aerobiophila]|uniref:Uncharacterized protein n=1 Tax=Nanobdella aerobiophila TaxID=2586965 RepID=A0A915SJS0_9ARCH|nr:hypothetical protein [Nanobdella aerobiophila]BBL45218.1 hypothetical protein MJ1_0039 [Nanobdella aerobiophila]
MRNDLAISTIIIIIIAIVVLIIAILFGYNIYKAGYSSSNTSANFINSSLNNITNQKIPFQ